MTNDPENRRLEDRLSALDEKLAERRGTRKDDKKASSGSGLSGMGNALRLSSEFIAAILVGAGIGYLIDTFAGTTPWAMIFFLLLGFVAGVVNVLRASGEMADPYGGGWANTPEQKQERAADDAPNGSDDEND